MRAIELLESGNVFTVRQKDAWTSDMDQGDGWVDIVEEAEFDVLHNGKVIGSISYESYFGNMRGDFGARGVEISRYEGPTAGVDLEQRVLSAVGNYFNSPTGRKHFAILSRQQGLEEQSPETLNPPSISVGDEVKVGKFKNRKAEVKGFTKDDHGQPVLKTTKGDQKLYKPRVSKLEPKEELEEIKVTKTLAGKRTMPTKDLASKEKMSRKKKYRDGSEIKDASTPMNRNVHDLANITLKGEYRS